MSTSTVERSTAALRSPPGEHRAESAANLQAVTVVVPVFNERECASLLMQSLAQLEGVLSQHFEFEFLLIDDGSTDGTAALLQAAVETKPNYRVIEHGMNRGIAAAIHTGIRASRNDIVVSIDCDGSYDPMLIAELVPQLTAGVDVVTASPYHRAGAVVNVPAWRLGLSRLASQMYAVLCRHKLTCYTSCFRVYRRDAVAPVELENERFVGVAELLWKVLERGGRVAEHPAMLRSRVAGHSKMRVVRASFGHLRLMGKIAASRLRRAS
jgi:dolichol-phosphate mannosyltransferase